MIRFYFDYVSPYAYLAWTRVRSMAARIGETIEPVPILFAALLDAWGQKGPAEIPPKREWLFKDVVRRARSYGVPLVPPPAHPFNPLPAARATLAVGDADRARAIDALYAATWGGGGGIDGADRVARVLSDAGLEGDAIVRDASTPEVKQRLRDLTETARSEGVFGVPTMVLRGELFWGDDSLPQLEAFARGEDTIDPAWMTAGEPFRPPRPEKRNDRQPPASPVRVARHDTGQTCQESGSTCERLLLFPLVTPWHR